MAASIIGTKNEEHAHCLVKRGGGLSWLLARTIGTKNEEHAHCLVKRGDGLSWLLACTIGTKNEEHAHCLVKMDLDTDWPATRGLFTWPTCMCHIMHAKGRA